VELEGGAVIVLVTRAVVDRCPALSRIAEHTYVATIGAGALATDRAASVMADATWERGRPYLVREPIALVGELAELRLVAVAQPDPLDAWLAVDAVDTNAVEQKLAKELARVRDSGAHELAGKLVLKRTGTQVSVHANGLTEEDVVTLAGNIVRELEASAPMPGPDAVFTCAPQGNGVVSCHDGLVYKVFSVETIVRELGGVDAAPVVEGGDIVGIRLLGDPKRLLRRDDIILGVDSHRITTARQLVELAPHLGGKVSIAVRRAGVEAVLDLSE
jgi:hypothetical protein